LLDSTKIRKELGWKPEWNIRRAVEKTCEWEKVRIGGGDVRECLDRQIGEYFDV
jgi:CDP-glucose 4,6-dehydratase